jgi:AAA15 family ATPase/GTPase
MIINLSIHNFGSIKDKQTLSFEADNSDHLENHYIIHGGGMRLLKLALIYGANASGKTTILKALDFLREIVLDPQEKKTEELNFNPFLFDPNTPTQNSSISIEFLHNEIKYLYEVEFSKRAVINESLYFFSPNKANIFKRTTDLAKEFTEISFGSKIKKDKTFEKTLEANTLWNNTVLGGYLKTNIELSELKNVVDWFKGYLNHLISTKTSLEAFVVSNIEKSNIKKEDVIKILKKADFNISNIVLSDREPMTPNVEKVFKALDLSDEYIEKLKTNSVKKIAFEHTLDGKSYSLPFKLESEGTKRYFEFAGLLCLLINKSKGIPIDELESSLHPDLYLHFLLSFLMNSDKSQIIATTHNREILNNKDMFRNDAIWFTDKSKDCATELYSLTDFDSSVIRDSSNILNAYKSGKLKATPHLGDYYIDLKQ